LVRFSLEAFMVGSMEVGGIANLFTAGLGHGGHVGMLLLRF